MNCHAAADIHLSGEKLCFGPVVHLTRETSKQVQRSALPSGSIRPGLATDFNPSPHEAVEMGYEISLGRALDNLERLTMPPRCTVPFLADRYEVRIDERAVLRQPSGVPAEEMVAVLILHYLIGIKRHGFQPSGEWISFKETDGGKAFWPAFQEGVMKPLTEGFQKDREGLARNLRERLGCKVVEGGDVAIEVMAFPGIFVRIIFWDGEDDLPAEATMLFDRGLNSIYCMEDVSALLLYIVREALNLDFL